MDWQDLFLRNKDGGLDDSFSVITDTNAYSDNNTDTTSSIAISAMRQREEREKKERLREYQQEQKRRNEDPDDSGFEQQEQEREDESTYVSRSDLIKMIEILVVELEGSDRLVPQDGEIGSVLTKGIDGLVFSLSAGGMPEATATGTIAVYKAGTGWETLEVPAEDDKFLMSDSGSDVGLSWQDDVWR